ncbi:hydrophobic surface binding protein [Mycena maculata]|uniref:Hydrophobic surface binding protein n=1 Tax=Mycena maculata TaxID=230809 RepID=A0AAD7HM95_9AGAR|nr:hydrophobic surface binding protein [Mycena maculata]
MVQISRCLTRTVATVEADIATVTTQLTALDTAIEAFPLTGGSLLAALGIHSDATTLITTLNGATSDVTANGALDDADGSTILASVEAIEPTILDALTDIVTKEPAFASLPIGGIPALILQDLENLQTATAAFAAALVSNAPADLVSEASTLEDNINAAFTPAIAAYS